ncbi:CD209 antigen-like protein E [Syngnathoides biaculeatus]|uniref:CD209 antigen-like protein E n=1 Tax=Syngnathoides biaculeatus TaxID=300417 RepID=UPI002ADE4B6F|nr:CD209 antigen-like protein E [Syngnathoides biaculeatus]XP_061675811.1 CD209 antigen-like protein E [Syngnathoides biaculeatus]XP_061675812.1 CD209 antigen-like protein E [Syngnathoides biaculeatus]XP_061675813.1 CD209 antigen-like protein E [Syngnathoides biaculeatus]
MEMQKAADNRKQLEEDAATDKPMLEDKGEGNPYTLADVPSEAPRGIYTGLQKPSEDIYSNVLEPTRQSAKQAQVAVRPYRVACLILTVACLALLLVVIGLLVKMKAKTSSCPVTSVSWDPPTCSKDQCTAFTSQDQHRCYCCSQCPPGWVRLEDSCFFFSTYRLNWQGSLKQCWEKGGSLAVVSSRKIQNFLSQCGNGMNYWIGLQRQKTTWTWVDFTNLQESYWKANLTAGDCAMLHSNGIPKDNWIMSSCVSYTYYICQMNLGTPVREATVPSVELGRG